LEIKVKKYLATLFRNKRKHPLLKLRLSGRGAKINEDKKIQALLLSPEKI
jgi:hypothetical protein